MTNLTPCGLRNPVAPFLFVLATLVALAAYPAQAQVAGGENLVLKRVMLSTGGVGYFEFEAQMGGAGELELEVRLDQVDDVLKSIVVYDDAGGVGAISLPGLQPLKQAFRDFPFGPEALSSPVALLNALQGAHINAVGQRRLSGRIIRVVPERFDLGDKGIITRHRVSLLTDKGVQQFILEEAESVSFVDVELQEQVNEALAATQRHRVRDKRTLRITMTGEGRRTVRVAYVVGVPLWKGTYRLTLPGRDGKPGTGHLQGWAVLENMSGRDWENIDLTVVSGNPVTFRQAIYSSYYINRPSVPVEVLGRILPRPDTGSVELEDKTMMRGAAIGGGLMKKEAQRRQGDRAVSEMVLSAPAKAMREVAAEPPRGVPGLAAVVAAASKEAATQVLFRLPNPVSVENGHTLVVPIVDADVVARRLALYQPATHNTHPLATVRLVNDGSSGLPPGVLTLYERTDGAVAYVGDARLGTLPAGEERLISFALDQKTRIDRSQGHARTLAKGAINRGVFRRTVVDRQTTTYRLEAPSREARTVIIEHPRMGGWKLVTPKEADVEATDKAYRIKVELEADGKEVVEVVMERPRLETVQVASLTLDNILTYARADKLDQKIRDAFARMAGLRAEIAKHRGAATALETERKSIFEDQRRVRDNLARVPRGGDLFNRYIAKMNSQENRLEDLVEKTERALARLKKAEGALAAFVAQLDV